VEIPALWFQYYSPMASMPVMSLFALLVGSQLSLVTGARYRTDEHPPPCYYQACRLGGISTAKPPKRNDERPEATQDCPQA
jgi:hypothetical protein